MSSPEAGIRQAILAKGQIILATHSNPDGDALGSLLGLADILEGMGKQVLRYLEETVSPLYRFLPGCGQTQTDIAQVRQFAARPVTICWCSASTAAMRTGLAGIMRNCLPCDR